jgi:hypothetical protein
MTRGATAVDVAKRYSTAVRGLKGELTERQCRESGAHATIERELGGTGHRHRPGPEELRAEAQRIRDWERDPDEAHYVCRHGTDLGHPWGPDYMCGTCEQFGQDEEANELEAYAAELEKEDRS